MQISTPPLAPAGETGPSVKDHARSGGRAEIAVCDASLPDQVHIARGCLRPRLVGRAPGEAQDPDPSLSGDGRQLYYLVGDRVVVAAVYDGQSFSAGAAQPVEALGDRIVDFSVSESGRIVAVREIDPGKSPLTIVRNWEQLLSER